VVKYMPSDADESFVTRSTPPPATVAVALLSLAVGIVLADSAIVTLALPSILRELDAQVSEVAWVLTGFNLVLALAAVPAAKICTRGAAGYAGAVGLVGFAAASAGCALAGSLEMLIVARVAQAIGGALVIASCLELLVTASHDERRGAARWAAAGVAGSAIGPVVGGLMTEAISWQSIFIIQVPLVLLALPVALRLRSSVERHDGPSDRPDLPANLALAFVSAALTAALFLLVLLLVEGWRRSPALAAVTVTAIPVAAVAAGPLARVLKAGTRAEAIAGSVLVGGGLACLGLLPDANPVWTIPAQVLVGLGLGLTVDSLTQSALADRVPRALQGGWTIAARHGGIVVGLLILTPIFTADLQDAQRPAQEAIAAQVLDSDLPATSKIKLADGLGAQLEAEDGRVPDLDIAFAKARLPQEQAAQAAALEVRLDDQLERAATRAFRNAFLAAAALALLAILPALFLREKAARP
jgi:MFS family permease